MVTAFRGPIKVSIRWKTAHWSHWDHRTITDTYTAWQDDCFILSRCTFHPWEATTQSGHLESNVTLNPSGRSVLEILDRKERSRCGASASECSALHCTHYKLEMKQQAAVVHLSVPSWHRWMRIQKDITLKCTNSDHSTAESTLISINVGGFLHNVTLWIHRGHGKSDEGGWVTTCC